MTIHASGSAITATQILNELGVASPVSGSWVASATLARRRELVGIPSGQVKFSDLYSKCAFQGFVSATDNMTITIAAGRAGRLAVFFGIFGSLGAAFTYNVYQIKSSPYAETFFPTDIIAAAKTNLRDGIIQGKFNTVSAPTGPNVVSATFQSVDTAGAGVALAENTFSEVSSSFGIIMDMNSSAVGAADVNTWGVDVTLRWNGVAASEVTKRFNFRIEHF